MKIEMEQHLAVSWNGDDFYFLDVLNAVQTRFQSKRAAYFLFSLLMSIEKRKKAGYSIGHNIKPIIQVENLSTMMLICMHLVNLTWKI